MTSWPLLTMPHGDTPLMLLVTTIISLSQLGIVAYWLWRWEKDSTLAGDSETSRHGKADGAMPRPCSASKTSSNAPAGDPAMTPLDPTTHAHTRRLQRTSRHWTLITYAALAVALTVSAHAQEWRFDHIDQRFADQERLANQRSDHIDQRFGHLKQRLDRLDRELWEHRLSHQDLWRTQGVVNVLRDIVRGLQREMAYLRALIEPPQAGPAPPPDIRRLPL